MKKLVIILITIVFFTSCKSKKGTTSKANMKLLNTVLDSYNKNNFTHKTVKASLKIKYEGEKYIPTVSASLRIKKDEVIWLSISKFISVGKLKITPNNVQFYNNLDNTYFDGDFSLLSNILGTEVNFQQIQSIFLGESIYNLNNSDFVIKAEDDSYIFTPKENDERFNIFFWLDATNFKTKKQEIRQNGGEKSLTLKNTEFEKINNTLFPKHIYILAKDSKKTNTINIDYKSVKFDLDLKFPFTIPDGYKEIKL